MLLLLLLLQGWLVAINRRDTGQQIDLFGGKKKKEKFKLVFSQRHAVGSNNLPVKCASE